VRSTAVVYKTSSNCDIKLWATFIYLINDEDLIHILTYCILKVTYVSCEHRQRSRLRTSYSGSYVLRVGLLLGFVHRTVGATYFVLDFSWGFVHRTVGATYFVLDFSWGFVQRTVGATYFVLDFSWGLSNVQWELRTSYWTSVGVCSSYSGSYVLRIGLLLGFFHRLTDILEH